MPRAGGRRALVLGAAATAFLAACGKSRVRPPQLVWFDDADLANAEARRLHRPLLLFFFATWDSAGKEMDRVTFTDGGVADLLDRHFVLVKIDCSDDEDPQTIALSHRYDMKGVPAMIVVHPAADREIWRITECVYPDAFVPALTAAQRRYVDIEAAMPAAAPRLVPLAR